jgi:hypothetical protein
MDFIWLDWARTYPLSERSAAADYVMVKTVWFDIPPQGASCLVKLSFKHSAACGQVMPMLFFCGLQYTRLWTASPVSAQLKLGWPCRVKGAEEQQDSED